jgi:hypothetical protein
MRPRATIIGMAETLLVMSLLAEHLKSCLAWRIQSTKLDRAEFGLIRAMKTHRARIQASLDFIEDQDRSVAIPEPSCSPVSRQPHQLAL